MVLQSVPVIFPALLEKNNDLASGSVITFNCCNTVNLLVPVLLHVFVS